MSAKFEKLPRSRRNQRSTTCTVIPWSPFIHDERVCDDSWDTFWDSDHKLADVRHLNLVSRTCTMTDIKKWVEHHNNCSRTEHACVEQKHRRILWPLMSRQVEWGQPASLSRATEGTNVSLISIRQNGRCLAHDRSHSQIEKIRHIFRCKLLKPVNTYRYYTVKTACIAGVWVVYRGVTEKFLPTSNKMTRDPKPI